MLLDIRMPHGDGFSVLEDLANPPYVIFETAHAEHAVRAFDMEAVDYLLKPFDDDRFERAIRRAKDIIRARRLVDLARDIGSSGPVAALPAADEADRIVVHEGRRISWVNAADVEWIEAADYYAQVHAHGRTHLVREPLQKLEERFGKKFLRVHRGALVNVARIQRLDRLEDSRVDRGAAVGRASHGQSLAPRRRAARARRALNSAATSRNPDSPGYSDPGGCRASPARFPSYRALGW